MFIGRVIGRIEGVVGENARLFCMDASLISGTGGYTCARVARRL